MKFARFALAALVSSGSFVENQSSGTAHALVVPFPPPIVNFPPVAETTSIHHQRASLQGEDLSRTTADASSRHEILSRNIQNWFEQQQQLLGPAPAWAADTVAPPNKAEIKLLREAFAAFYGVDRDLEKSQDLLSQAIAAWQRQPADEKAGLYRVRADCYMALLKPEEAEKDYTTAIDLLSGPGGDLADPQELPLAVLGRARSIRSQGLGISSDKIAQAARDYQRAVRLSSREDWGNDAENEEDGATRNPYAAWEWGSMLRLAGDLDGAYRAHGLASVAFNDIGDRARSVISLLDAGIDLAATDRVAEAKDILTKAIKKTKTVEGRDVKLLQRVIAKEGEAQVALASVLWNAGERQEAETQLGTACVRLDQLVADAEKRSAVNKETAPPAGLKYSIDDEAGAFDVGCSRFKNEAFLTNTLQWPDSLKKKVIKLETLGR